jgi:MFS transporter, DHA2 family, multidrug resistance protein
MAIGLGSLIAFLEEGQNDDWFTSVFIQRCFALAVIFISLFIICELVTKTPVVNLRLLGIRNLALASAVNFLLGASLYGSVFLLPEYLEQVQQYSAKQTGEAMVLIGLPQLLIFPIVPRLMKKFDLRLIVFAGALIFGGSCLLNIYMNPEFSGPQFQFANIRPRAGTAVHHCSAIRSCHCMVTAGTTGGRIGYFQHHEKSGRQRRHRVAEHDDYSA